jgi:hypothetical protein
MRPLRFVVAIVALAMTALPLRASGPLGIYGIIERVVFEPNETAPERVQVWGAFAYGEIGMSQGTSPAAKGYLYFKLPTETAGSQEITAVKNEWRDLKSVAGTGQAVGFGTWGYIGAFSQLTPETKSSNPPYILERRPSGGTTTDMRVRPATETPSNPAAYQTNVGVVKLAENGSQADIVKKLRAALGK